MVVGDADGPLLHRHLDRVDLHVPFRVQPLLLALSTEDEGAGVGGVGEEVVHRPVAGAGPADAALADRSARQLLPLGDQFDDDLAS
jgi:hypothetical protein